MSKTYLEHRDKHHVPGASSKAEIDLALGRVADALLDCDAWLITAGAGMGVDSGLPDFRGTTGLWKDRDVAMTYEDMSDDKWFREDPQFAWGSNYTQLEMYRNTEPHAGFGVLLKWFSTLGKPCYIFTSNIDSQFEKAGFPREKVATCHGDLHHLQCIDRNCRGLEADKSDEVWSAECIPSGLGDCIDAGSIRFKEAESLEAPYFHCPRCGKLARPNIWFCHDRNYVPREESIQKRDNYNRWLNDLKEAKAKVVVIECGGGLAIPSVRVESEDMVDECGPGSLLVRVNPTDNKVPAEKAVGLPFGSCKGLGLIDEKLEAAQASRNGHAPRRRSPPSSSAANGAEASSLRQGARSGARGSSRAASTREGNASRPSSLPRAKAKAKAGPGTPPRVAAAATDAARNVSAPAVARPSHGVWSVPLIDLVAAMEEAFTKGKTPLLIDSTEGHKVEMFFTYGGAFVIDCKRMIQDQARGVDVQSLLSQTRDSFADANCFKSGQVVVFRLSNTACDIKGTFSNELFPALKLLDAKEVAKVLGAGQAHNFNESPFHCMCASDDQRLELASRGVNEKFRVMAITHFLEEEYADLLDPMFPLDLVQPIKPLVTL